MMSKALSVLLAVLFFVEVACGGESVLVEDGFEAGPRKWKRVWSRTPEASLAVDNTRPHGGNRCVRINHTGTEDWSLNFSKRFDVSQGEIYRFDAWVRLRGAGEILPCGAVRDREGNVLDWSLGAIEQGATEDWKRLRTWLVIPDEVVTLEPRFIGRRPSTVWIDDVVLKKLGTLDDMRGDGLANTLEVSNRMIKVAVNTRDATLIVHDRRTDRSWRQRPVGSSVVVRKAQVDGHAIHMELLDPAVQLDMTCVVHVDETKPEFVVELGASGRLRRRPAFPHAFVTGKDTFLVMPVNEGISYPVDDKTLPEMWYHLHGGHGLCMAWWGVTDGTSWLMGIVETPDDAAVGVRRVDGRLCLQPEWRPQKGRFGPKRVIRYVLGDTGGYVAMTKRYRRRVEQVGSLKTLAEKRKENPDVDKLVGAVNVWCRAPDAPRICRKLREAGIRRILWSHRRGPDEVKQLNEMGVLTGRYDIYQDAMNPAMFPRLRYEHPDWTSEAWPEDLMTDKNGEWVRGWRVKTKDGEMYPCGVLCDLKAPAYARKRIAAELDTHPYHCRFIDTTTASPWRECYHPDHPMTRSQSREAKMKLLKVVSEEFNLITGSETGHEAAVPYLHYFEGMMSLGPYRIPDAGRGIQRILHDVPDRVAKFQTGHYYRLPLWELVYHDCVVAQWYWGDYNNKLPSLWDRRDLFNALYGTPPMFMFKPEMWRRRKDRFARSYNTATPIARATGYAEMLSHRWLTPDHSVQQTRFDNGVTVTVNFGEEPYEMKDGEVLAPMGHRFEGVKQE